MNHVDTLITHLDTKSTTYKSEHLTQVSLYKRSASDGGWYQNIKSYMLDLQVNHHPTHFLLMKQV